MRTSGASRLGQFVKTRKKPRNRTPIENSCQFSLMTNLHKRKCNSKLSGMCLLQNMIFFRRVISLEKIVILDTIGQTRRKFSLEHRSPKASRNMVEKLMPIEGVLSHLKISSYETKLLNINFSSNEVDFFLYPNKTFQNFINEYVYLSSYTYMLCYQRSTPFFEKEMHCIYGYERLARFRPTAPWS